MEDIDVIFLEDGKEYIVIDEIKIKNITYVYLSEYNNSKNFCVRKLKEENGINTLINLDNEKEFMMTMKKLEKNHN